MTKKHKVVITGANGFVGSNLVRHCLEMDCSVTGLVRKKSGTSLLPSDFQPVRTDYHDLSAMKSVIEGHEILIHNAAITRGKNWKEFYGNNVELTTRLVELANSTDSIKQFIFISSQAASGVCKVLSAKKEDEECVPLSNYGKSKLLAEERVKSRSRKNWTIIRPASVFGRGDTDFLHYFKLVRNGFSFLLGYKRKYISLIPVNCLVDFIYKTFDNPKTYNEIFFASCGSYYCWEDFINSLEEAMDRKTIRIRIPEFLVYPVALWGELKGIIFKRPALINLQKLKEMKGRYWICDSGKAKEILGCGHHLDLSNALRETYEWYKENRWL